MTNKNTLNNKNSLCIYHILVSIFCSLQFSLFFTACSSSPTRTKNPSEKTMPSPVRNKNKPLQNTVTPKSEQLASPTIPTAMPTIEPEATAKEMEKDANFLGAVKEYSRLAQNSTDTKSREKFYVKSVEIVESRLSEGDLLSVANTDEFGELRASALFRLGESALQRRDLSDARRYFSSIERVVPNSDMSMRAQEFISQIDSLRVVDSKTIGLILPLSGKNAQVSQRVLHAIEMGLGFTENSSQFRLAIMDSEGNPDLARQGVERLAKEDHVIAIIGDILSKNASAVSAKADEMGIPTINLSQKSGITDIGPSIFRNSLTSEMQVQELVRAAFESGMRKFAILYPNDSYGVEFANIFWDQVLARGGSITAVQSYSGRDTDFRHYAQRLVGTFYLEARLEEFKFRQGLLKSSDIKRSARQESSADDILPPIVDFDGVFIPDSAKTMSQLAAFLSFSGVKNVHLLGTNLWNSPGLAKRAGKFSNNILFVDGVLSKNQRQQGFFAEYYKQFGEDAGLLELQAYEAAVILRQLLSSGSSSRESLIRALAELKTFKGPLGTLSMSPEREIVRPVLALTLDKSGEIIPLRPTN